MFKKNKHGQALVETIIVMGIYFFLIGFLISSFQVMYNKLVLTVAAYEAARTAAVYESSEVYAQSGNYVLAYNRQMATENADRVIDEGILAKDLINYKIEIYGQDNITGKSTTLFDGKQLYARANISGTMEYMFPIVSPSLGSLIQDSITFDISFVMPRERIWNT